MPYISPGKTVRQEREKYITQLACPLFIPTPISSSGVDSSFAWCPLPVPSLPVHQDVSISALPLSHYPLGSIVMDREDAFFFLRWLLLCRLSPQGTHDLLVGCPWDPGMPA